jgi:hypothetical protein
LYDSFSSGKVITSKKYSDYLASSLSLEDFTHSTLTGPAFPQQFTRIFNDTFKNISVMELKQIDYHIHGEDYLPDTEIDLNLRNSSFAAL